MNFEQAKDFINSKALTELKKDNSGTGFICPICNSGTGKNGTGIKTKDNIHFTCFSNNCFSNASWIDILAIKGGISPDNTREAISNACKIYGIEIDSSTAQKPTENYQKATENTYTADFTKWHKAINEQAPADYLRERGITADLVERFNLGYCSNIQGIPAIIFPTGSNSFIARNINKNCDKGNRYRKSKGAYEIFNIKALETSEQPIFITEGEFDALSIMRAGAVAIGIGGIANLDKVILRAKQLNTKQPLIIALDNDDSGKNATEKLKAQESELEQAGLKIYFPDVNRFYFGKKDANEALLENDFYFENVVNDVREESTHLDEIKRQEAILQLQKDSVSNAKDAFNKTIEKSKTASFIPTGFNNLDNLLDGGLYTGLYIVGAISSLGKTTLCLQIGDQIAKAGNDVLIFSLEMSKMELIAKSISRLTSILDLELSNSNTNAKTTRGILTGSKYSKYNATELKLIQQAKDLYFNEYAPNLYIYEGMGNIGIKQIRDKVEAFKAIKGKAPTVIIDYLQILAPAPDNKFLTDKQNTDINVMELKRISRDYEISVIGISSFNRDNYNAPVNMASFKESGAIEYSSDVLIGLQYKAMSDLKEDGKDKAKASVIFSEIAEKAKNREPIEIQLKILKNRNGNKGSTDFEFYPMFNKFKEPAVRPNSDNWH